MTTVLVVDDELAIRRMLGYMLGKTQYNVVMAGDAQEALEKLAEQSVDVILLDVAMPNMDGITLLEQLRMTPSYCHLPVIMLTAGLDEVVRARALRAGADFFLNKFVRASELLELIERVVQRSKQTEKAS